MHCRVRGSQARGLYPTQDTSHMETVRIKQEKNEIKKNHGKTVVGI